MLTVYVAGKAVAAELIDAGYQLPLQSWLAADTKVLAVVVAGVVYWALTSLEARAGQARKDREARFVVSASKLQRELQDFLRGTQTKSEFDSFAKTLLGLLVEALNQKRGHGANFMFYDPQADQMTIEAHRRGKGPEIDIDFSVKAGEGCAGLALERGMTVYVPHIGRLHGLILNTREGVAMPKFKVAPNIFAPIRKREFAVFESAVSVPVLSPADRAPYGVINCDSNSRDPFDPLDFTIMQHFSRGLGIALDALH